ncbi:hypothetical protein JOM56_014985, partial [Amanita muscaria]
RVCFSNSLGKSISIIHLGRVRTFYITLATLDAPTQLPPALQSEGSPSSADLIAQIDRWIIYHLKATISSEVHYENQLYGCLNTFLFSLFPPRRQFMTIPQAIIRRAMGADEVDEDLGNISFGSTGALHESRELPDMEAEKCFPDFVTVRVAPQPGGLRQHFVVCVVEVKRDHDTMSEAHIQIMKYMNQLAEHPLREENLSGFLVMGRWVTVYTLVRSGTKVEPVRGDTFDMFAHGDRFTSELAQIAVRNWN